MLEGCAAACAGKKEAEEGGEEGGAEAGAASGSSKGGREANGPPWASGSWAAAAKGAGSPLGPSHEPAGPASVSSAPSTPIVATGPVVADPHATAGPSAVAAPPALAEFPAVADPAGPGAEAGALACGKGPTGAAAGTAPPCVGAESWSPLNAGCASAAAAAPAAPAASSCPAEAVCPVCPVCPACPACPSCPAPSCPADAAGTACPACPAGSTADAALATCRKSVGRAGAAGVDCVYRSCDQGDFVRVRFHRTRMLLVTAVEGWERRARAADADGSSSQLA